MAKEDSVQGSIQVPCPCCGKPINVQINVSVRGKYGDGREEQLTLGSAVTHSGSSYEHAGAAWYVRLNDNVEEVADGS